MFSVILIDSEAPHRGDLLRRDLALAVSNSTTVGNTHRHLSDGEPARQATPGKWIVITVGDRPVGGFKRDLN